MKYILALCFIVTLFSCKNETKKGKLLSKDSLPTQQFTITTDRDTTLQTTNGALLKIPKGAIVSETGNTATLEIKEAYSLEDMIMAGLTTSANGQPLSSGGMIYINGAAGQNLKLTQPVKVALPTDFFVDGMKLYKGDTTNGDINWTNAQPLPVTEQMKAVSDGMILFQQQCSSCHGIGKVISGPDLAHFKNRLLMSENNESSDADRNSLESFHSAIEDITVTTELPGEMSENPDSSYRRDTFIKKNFYHHPNLYACNLRQMFGGQAGPQFPGLKKEEWKSIFDYIQTESDRRDLPLPQQAYLAASIDSCKLYDETVKLLTEARSKTEQERAELVAENGMMVEKNLNNTTVIGGPPTEIKDTVLKLEDKVSPESFGAEYYQFTVDGFGWYNIDMLSKDMPGVEESELLVRVNGEYKDKVELYLVIPSSKTFSQAGPTEKNDNEYAFYTKDGRLPLPLGAKSYILAMTESGGNFAFTIFPFNATKQQVIEIELKEATKKEFRKAMKVFGKKDLKIRVQDSKNADKIRLKDADLKAIDKQLQEAEVLKPRGCDCNCGNNIFKSLNQ